MNLSQNIAQLLKDIGPGQMKSTAYDTAWVARLAKTSQPRGIAALEWLRTHQMDDGTWGAESPKYYHDRLVCTLAAAIALATVGDARDLERLERAKVALETVIPELAEQAMMETIGFEMIIPTLFDEAESLGIIRRKDYSDMERLNAQRAMKMAGLPGGVISRYVTLAFSAEMAGPDGQHLLDIPNLQEANGSLGHSPSATAYFLTTIAPGNSAAKEYLYQLPVDDGGIPNVAPFDNFERSWTLWNLMTTGDMDDEMLALCQPHLEFLETTWTPGVGAAFGHGYSARDADMTSVIFEVLSRFGRRPDEGAILTFEGEDYFRCFMLEANPSVSVNIHVLGALREAGFAKEHPSVQKIVRFLHDMQYWFDKWHSSPYYPTAHAVIACAGYLDELVADAITWILSTQNTDGSWGYFMPTAEETAYSLQALFAWKRAGYEIPNDVLRNGAGWLANHIEPPYPPLWIGKCLYAPVLVVRSAILSALLEVSQVLGEEVCEPS
jgi:halimadienyl-diphosphate synthase